MAGRRSRSVFLSYCHADFDDRDTFLKYLEPMCDRMGDALDEWSLWVDARELLAGVRWKPAIRAALEAADVYIVLLSQDYRKSVFCMQEELAWILLRCDRGEATVIGIALHKVNLLDFSVTLDDGRSLSIEEVQCLPQGVARNGSQQREGLVPLTQWPEKRDAWHEVQMQLEKALLAPSLRATAPVRVAKGAPAAALHWPAVNRDALLGPDGYDPDPALTDAVNMALYLDMPLLLTGEPGTGKTQLAEKLARDLEVDLHRFETHSVSQAQDLLYQFDPVARLHAAQLRVGADKLEPLRFVEYGPLGRAILQGLEKAEAPTDFPNDLLSELERHEFCVREHKPDAKLKANSAHRPIVIVTSNEERTLPDAFLWRCVFFHLEPMPRERLAQITRARLDKAGLKLSEARLNEALDLYERLRSDEMDLRKKPSTAEFLAFAAVLAQRGARSRRWGRCW